MNAKKIPVVRVGRAGASGAPEEFERHFERKRQPRQASVVRKPTLKPIDNLSMEQRLEELGLRG